MRSLEEDHGQAGRRETIEEKVVRMYQVPGRCREGRISGELYNCSPFSQRGKGRGEERGKVTCLASQTVCYGGRAVRSIAQTNEYSGLASSYNGNKQKTTNSSRAEIFVFGVKDVIPRASKSASHMVGIQ